MAEQKGLEILAGIHTVDRDESLYSIAISLKRIADSLEKKLIDDKAYEAWKHENLYYMLKNK